MRTKTCMCFLVLYQVSPSFFYAKLHDKIGNIQVIGVKEACLGGKI